MASGFDVGDRFGEVRGGLHTLITFSNSLFFPCQTKNCPCANVRDLCLLHTQH